MKVAAIIVVIIGVLASAGLGIYWATSYTSEEMATISADAKSLGIDVDSELKAAEKQRNSGYVLIAGAVLSLVSVLLVGKLKKISAIIILLSAIAPAFFYPGALVASFLLIIGAILAFFVKPKVVAAAA